MPRDYTDYTFLLENLRKGDVSAFDHLYRTSRNRLFAIAHSIVDDHDAAKDIVQEFFVDFFQNRHYLHVTNALKTYLYNSIRNKSFNYIRNKTSQEKRHSRLYEDSQRINHQQNTLDIEYHLDREMISNEIQSAISNLPPMAEKVFTMHYLQLLSHAEIAEKLNISKHTVSNHISRALQQLRTELKKNL
jgi:RNA polymerase sigma-70 factor (family 1)